jgi:hypothetical protein
MVIIQCFARSNGDTVYILKDYRVSLNIILCISLRFNTNYDRIYFCYPELPQRLYTQTIILFVRHLRLWSMELYTAQFWHSNILFFRYLLYNVQNSVRAHLVIVQYDRKLEFSLHSLILVSWLTIWLNKRKIFINTFNFKVNKCYLH